MYYIKIRKECASPHNVKWNKGKLSEPSNLKGSGINYKINILFGRSHYWTGLSVVYSGTDVSEGVKTTILPLLLLFSPVIQVSQPFLTIRPTTLSLRGKRSNCQLGVLTKAADITKLLGVDKSRQ
jgi:hypothetical protein